MRWRGKERKYEEVGEKLNDHVWIVVREKNWRVFQGWPSRIENRKNIQFFLVWTFFEAFFFAAYMKNYKSIKKNFLAIKKTFYYFRSRRKKQDQKKTKSEEARKKRQENSH